MTVVMMVIVSESHEFLVHRAPTVPTTSRMHFSCCCPSCRSHTSRASTAEPPQNQQHRHNTSTHIHTHVLPAHPLVLMYLLLYREVIENR